MPTVLTFGPFRIDISAEILFRGTEPLSVGRRALALLRALLERPGVPVSKEALMEAAWPGLAVEESNLTVQIASLRRVLSEEPGGERWIETLSRRGYRFVGPVPTEESVNAPVPRPFLTPDLPLPDDPAVPNVTVEGRATQTLTKRPAGDLLDPHHSPATFPFVHKRTAPTDRAVLRACSNRAFITYGTRGSARHDRNTYAVGSPGGGPLCWDRRQTD
jgi:DNA-binding winged helix-turn-helix (wHTH) protein